MAFTWTEDISPGATITAAAINELRQNLDYVKDNECTDHDSTVDSNDKTVENGWYFSTYRDADRLGDYSSYCSSDEGIHDDIYYGKDNTTYNSDYDGTINSNQCTADYSTHDGVIKTNEDHTYYSGNDSGFFSGLL